MGKRSQCRVNQGSFLEIQGFYFYLPVGPKHRSALGSFSSKGKELIGRRTYQSRQRQSEEVAVCRLPDHYYEA